MNQQQASESTSQRITNPEPKDSLSPRPLRVASSPLRLAASSLLHHPGLLIALTIYLGLAFAYFFIVPIFENPDEWTHMGHINYIAEGNGLPVMLPGQGIWGGQQPPLYYALGALLIQPFELDAFDDYLKEGQNPHASLGYALDPGNKNNFLHTASENFPYRGLSLTVHILRLYSMIYGLIALIFIYLTALDIFDFRFWSLAGELTNRKSFATFVVLFVACQPMFAFITASVANEPANIAFCTIGLWLAQRYVLYGPSPRWGRAVTLGVVLGLISLSKMTGLSFGLVVVVALLLTAIATRKQPGAARLLWRDCLIIGLLFLAIGGWWYWRNYQLYGDFFQRGLYKLYFNVDPQPLSLSDFLYTLSTGEVSFWATFGWLNIVAPEWVYSVYRIISRVGLVGVALVFLIQVVQEARRRRGGEAGTRGGGDAKRRGEEAESRGDEGEEARRRGSESSGLSSYASVRSLPVGRLTHHAPRFPPQSEASLWDASRFIFILHPSSFILHLVFPLALAFSLTRLVAIEGGLQGRQLLPALGSIAIVIVGGWWVLTPDRLRLPLLTLLITLLLGLAVWLPFGVVAPQYIPRPLLTEADLPADLSHLNLIYKDEMKLIGVKVGTDLVHPGERVPVTAYWQALKPMKTNYSVFVHLIGRSYQDVGQFNTYPGLGLRPTRTLKPGQIIADTYPVLVEGGTAAPTRLLVNIGLFDFNEPGRPGIQAMTPDGQPAASTVGQLKLAPVEWPPIPTRSPIAEFHDNIWLSDYSIENCRLQTAPCQITFAWLALAKPSTDYTVFIQLWRNGQKVLGFDAQPLSGDYSTSLWDKHELILDPHSLDLSTVSPGKYQILAGLYNLNSGDRLPASADGSFLPNYAVNLGTIQLK